MDLFGQIPTPALSRIAMDPEPPVPGLGHHATVNELPDEVAALEGLKMSFENFSRLQLIQQLMNDLGLNLAGVEQVLQLQDEVERMERRLDRMQREMRDVTCGGFADR